MRQRIHVTVITLIITLISGFTTATSRAQENGTNAADKMTSHQMMDKLTHMSSAEEAAMFDKMTESEKMHAMKMAGHDMSKMSHQESTEMMGKVAPEQKAAMFEKMPMDTKMATMKMAMKEHKATK